MDGVNIQTGRDMFRLVDKIRYIVRDIKDAFKKQLKDLQSKHYKELLSEQFVPELNSRIEAGLSKYEGDNSRLINDHEKRLNLVEGTVSDIRARIKNHGIILGESATDGSKFEKTGLEINPFD